MKALAKKILPSSWQKKLWKLYCWLRGIKAPPSQKISFSGDYANWDDACRACEGYAAPQILEKVRAAALKVKNGQAAFERDSVTFVKPDYSWPLLASLLCAAAENNGELNVVDFGGSLGSIYFQHRKFFKDLPSVHWRVIEQPHFVRIGNDEIAEGPLGFCLRAQEAVEGSDKWILLLSGVLQCLPDPHAVLCDLLNLGWSHVIVDRTAFVTGRAKDRLTVQTVPASIYSAKYPSWFFNQNRLIAHFDRDFELVSEWAALDRFDLVGDSTRYRGFYLRRHVNHP